MDDEFLHDNLQSVRHLFNCCLLLVVQMVGTIYSNTRDVRFSVFLARQLTAIWPSLSFLPEGGKIAKTKRVDCPATNQLWDLCCYQSTSIESCIKKNTSLHSRQKSLSHHVVINSQSLHYRTVQFPMFSVELPRYPYQHGIATMPSYGLEMDNHIDNKAL